jgi:hypothetical protein
LLHIRLAAHQAGLITAWKHEGERGYRMVMWGRQDRYVEAAKLAEHLPRLAHPKPLRTCSADARMDTELLHARLSASAALVEPATAALVSPTVRA